MFEHTYTYLDHPRLGLWWHQPNFAACFLIMIYFVTIGIRKCVGPQTRFAKIVRGALLGVESLLLVTLPFTYSRGGVVALLAVGAIQGVSAWIDGSARSAWRTEAGKLALFGLAWFATGNAGRFQDGLAGTDRSVTNRAEILVGGLHLLRDNFPFGVGVGNSGELYSNWLAPLEKDYATATLIGGLPTLVVEKGLVALLVGSFVAAALLAIVFLSREAEANRVRAGLARYGALAALAFWAANLFSNILLDSSLTWFFIALTLIAATAALVQNPSRRNLLKPLAWCGAATACAVALVVVATMCLPASAATVDVTSGTATLIYPATTEGTTAEVVLWGDRRVIGFNRGKTQRRLGRNFQGVRLTCPLYLNNRPWLPPSPPDIEIFFGERWKMKSSPQAGNPRVVVACPIGAPDAGMKFEILLLPEFDTSLGVYSLWEARAHEVNAQVIRIAGTGAILADDVGGFPDALRAIVEQVNASRLGSFETAGAGESLSH